MRSLLLCGAHSVSPTLVELEAPRFDGRPLNALVVPENQESVMQLPQLPEAINNMQNVVIVDKIRLMVRDGSQNRF